VPITLNVLNSSTLSLHTTTVTRIISTLGNENTNGPFNKTYIIILATVIPVVLIVIIGTIIKIKRSSSNHSSAKKTPGSFVDLKHHQSSSNDFELEATKKDYVF
jgi:uncharacterized membrane protein